MKNKVSIFLVLYCLIFSANVLALHDKLLDTKFTTQNLNTKSTDSVILVYDSITNYLKLSPSYYDSLRKSKDFSYVKDGLKSKPTLDNNSIEKNTFWTKYGKYILLSIGFLAALIMIFKNGSLFLLRKSPKNIIMDAPDEVIKEDIFSLQYNSAIAQAEKDNDFRLAIRLYYLQVLKLMSQKQLIRYSNEKSNFEYLNELRHQPCYPQFKNITKHYEYIWYGLFPISTIQYNIIVDEFKSFIRNI